MKLSRYILLLLIVLGLGILLSTLLPKPSNDQLDQLEIISRQLQEIKKQDDALLKQLQDFKKQSAAPTKTLQGQASVYSVDGCLGCDPRRIMANGEQLDDRRATLALPCHFSAGRCMLDLPLNTRVMVLNVSTGKAIAATVTDTGGFAKYGRIADLSLATAQAIGCQGLCQVKIY